MSRESKQERREMRDRFAMAAMQSLIQNYATMDRNGYSRPVHPDREDFISIAGEALQLGGWCLLLEGKLSARKVLAYEAYEIAEAMMDMRSEINEVEDCHEENTKEPESTANQSGRGNDGSRVLEVPAVESAAGESQVGSDQQACSERLQESQPER
jgi:hypothetical protein